MVTGRAVVAAAEAAKSSSPTNGMKTVRTSSPASTPSSSPNRSSGGPGEKGRATRTSAPSRASMHRHADGDPGGGAEHRRDGLGGEQGKEHDGERGHQGQALGAGHAGPTSPATIWADSVTSGSPPPGCEEPPTRNSPGTGERLAGRRNAADGPFEEVP